MQVSIYPYCDQNAHKTFTFHQDHCKHLKSTILPSHSPESTLSRRVPHPNLAPPSPRPPLQPHAARGQLSRSEWLRSRLARPTTGYEEFWRFIVAAIVVPLKESRAVHYW